MFHDVTFGSASIFSSHLKSSLLVAHAISRSFSFSFVGISFRGSSFDISSSSCDFKYMSLHKGMARQCVCVWCVTYAQIQLGHVKNDWCFKCWYWGEVQVFQRQLSHQSGISAASTVCITIIEACVLQVSKLFYTRNKHSSTRIQAHQSDACVLLWICPQDTSPIVCKQ